jgi:hypothetical protein
MVLFNEELWNETCKCTFVPKGQYQSIVDRSRLIREYNGCKIHQHPSTCTCRFYGSRYGKRRKHSNICPQHNTHRCLCWHEKTKWCGHHNHACENFDLKTWVCEKCGPKESMNYLLEGGPTLCKTLIMENRVAKYALYLEYRVRWLIQEAQRFKHAHGTIKGFIKSPEEQQQSERKRKLQQYKKQTPTPVAPPKMKPKTTPHGLPLLPAQLEADWVRYTREWEDENRSIR